MPVQVWHSSGRAGKPDTQKGLENLVDKEELKSTPSLAEYQSHLVDAKDATDFDMDKIEVYRVGPVLGVRGSTWCMSPKVERKDFDDAFAKSYYQAARDYGSAPPSAAQPLVQDSQLADKRVNQSRRSPVLMDGSFANWFRGGKYEYFLHMDMAAKRDTAGVAMCHYDHEKDIVVMDLMMGVKPPEGGELRLERFKNLVYELNNLGFSLRMVSFDSWQSLAIQQDLKARGFNVGQLSVDRTTKAYDTLVELMLAGRIDFYYEPTFMREFSELELIEGKKIDHPVNGSKDISDAVAAVCVHAMELARVVAPRLPGAVKFANQGGGGNSNFSSLNSGGLPIIGGVTAESVNRKMGGGEDRNIFAI
jgi:hypothetical protein